MYYDFLRNVILVLFLCGVVILIKLSVPKKYSPFLMGLMFGVITIGVMSDRIMIAEGHFFDFRHITMTLSGYIGGPIAALVAAVLSSLYRYYAGGSGSMGGIMNIIVFAGFGSILGRVFKDAGNKRSLLFWFLIGLVMAVVLLTLIALFTQANPNSVAFATVKYPFLLLTPLATMIIFNFYFWAYDFLGKAFVFNALLKDSPLNLMIFNQNHRITLSNYAQTQAKVSAIFSNPELFLGSDNLWMHSEQLRRREIKTEDGSYFTADLCRIEMPSGELACAAVVNDITSQKQDYECLQGAKDRFAKAFELGPHMMAIIRVRDYKYVDVNRRFLETRNFAREDVIGKTPIEIGVPEGEFRKIIEILKKQGTVQNLECSLVTKSGAVCSAIVSADMIRIEDQECILLAYNDVTEMKQLQIEKVEQLTQRLKLEEELSRSNQLIADIINNMPDVFYVLDDQGRFTFLNKKTEKLFGKTRDELIGSVLWDVLPSGTETLLRINYQKVLSEGVPVTFEVPSVFQKDTWYQITAFPSQFGLTVYYRDTTERKQARESLIKSQKETADILESMTDCFFAIDDNWRFTYINRPGEIAFGRSRDEVLGNKITDMFKLNDQALQHYHEVMNEKKSVTFEILSELAGNKWIEISLYPKEDGLTCFFQDISSRKIAEEEMVRLDRLNLVGQLAAGIGHEIRNPMTTVRGYLQLLGEKRDFASQKETFALMISELDRANSIITEFLSLARTRQTELQSQNLNDLIYNLYPLLEADSFIQQKSIRFIPGEIPNLNVNEKEISQAIINLIRNGLEAMPEKGCVTIKTYVENGDVVVSVQDEGTGIAADILNRIGTPFFTTKDTGTGLGLAICYKIIDSHNAKIQLETSPLGTTFFIIFPKSDEDKSQREMIA